MSSVVYVELNRFKDEQLYSVDANNVIKSLHYNSRRNKPAAKSKRLLPKKSIKDTCNVQDKTQRIQCTLSNLKTQELHTDIKVLEGAKVPKGSGSIKLLPTKATLVNSTHPHIRTKQHYASEEVPATKQVTTPSIDDIPLTEKYNQILQFLSPSKTTSHSGGIDDLQTAPYDEINTLLNNASSFDPQKLDTLMAAYVDHAHTLSQGHATMLSVQDPGVDTDYDKIINKVFGGLNLKHSINNTSLSGYLFDKLQSKKTFTYAVDDVMENGFATVLADKLPKDSSAHMQSSNIDKKFALFNVRRNSMDIPVQEKNDHVNAQMDMFVDSDFISHSLKTDLISGNQSNSMEDALIERAHPVRDTTTLIDYNINKHGIEHTTKILSDTLQALPEKDRAYVQSQLTGQDLDYQMDSIGLHMLGASVNPRAMEQVLHASDVRPVAMLPGNIKKYTASLIESWGYSSNMGLSDILNRALPHFNRDSPVQYTRPDSSNMFQKSTLTEDKLPLNFSDVIHKIKGITDSYTSSKMSSLVHKGNDTLYRGISFLDSAVKDNDVFIHQSLASTSATKNTALDFGQVHSSEKPIKRHFPEDSFKDTGLHLPDTMSAYVTQIDEYKDRRYLLHFDKKKLIEDKKIFAIVDYASLEYMTKHHGIPDTENLRTYEDEDEFIVNFH